MVTRYRARIARLIVGSLVLLATQTPCRAAESIEERVSAATAVVVGRFVRFTPAEPARVLGRGQLPPDRPPGTYTLDVKARLKGACADTINVSVLAMRWVNYGVRGVVDLPEGSLCLMFLSGNAPNWTSFTVMPLADAVELPSPSWGGQNPPPAAVAEWLLLGSLNDPRCRVVCMHHLGGTHSDAVVKAARALLNDRDIDMQWAAVCCLAANKVVEVIPRIAEIQEKLRETGGAGGRNLITVLDEYQTPDAVPYLNAMLFNSESSTARVIAIGVLGRLADQSSIPYLMVALRDPEPQQGVSYTAYLTLHRLIPELGAVKDRATFLNESRETEIQRVEKWWTDKLASSRGRTPPLVLPRSAPPAPAAPSNAGPRSSRGPAD